MRRAAGTWLSGPEAANPNPVDNDYRGQDLGLPQAGPGSLAGGWHRSLGLLYDWLLSAGVALIFVDMGSQILGTAVLGVWFVVGMVTVRVFGFTPGQYIAGLRVARVDHGPERNRAEAAGEVGAASVGIFRAFFRQLMMVFLVPALVNDYNGRALHDRATGTAMVRTR